MSAMVLGRAGEPLRLESRPVPKPGDHELLLEVAACGVCRTDLHVADGDIHGPLPIVPGHEIVGRVIELGREAGDFAVGDRVGVPWLGGTCGRCFFCLRGQENLCDAPTFTGFSRDGGFATHVVADSRYCFRLPESFGDVEAAPLLCAGLIGYRALKLAGDAERLGFYGFGAAATFSRSWPSGRAGGSSPSRRAAIRKARSSPARSAVNGPAPRTRTLPKSWMRRSSLRRSER